MPTASDAQVRQIQEGTWNPLETFDKYKGVSSAEEINPNYITPHQGLVRLQKIMDEYRRRDLRLVYHQWPHHGAGHRPDGDAAGGPATPGSAQPARADAVLGTGAPGLGGRSPHAPPAAPPGDPLAGYYYRADYPNLDDDNWRVFVNSRFDAQTGGWSVFTKPYIQIFR